MAKKIVKRKGDIEVICYDCAFSHDFYNIGAEGYPIMCKCQRKQYEQLSRVPKVCRIAKIIRNGNI